MKVAIGGGGNNENIPHGTHEVKLKPAPSENSLDESLMSDIHLVGWDVCGRGVGVKRK